MVVQQKGKRLQAWIYIMLPHLVLLTEYSTEVLKVFRNFITLKSFSLQIHAKTKYKTSKKLKR